MDKCKDCGLFDIQFDGLCEGCRMEEAMARHEARQAEAYEAQFESFDEDVCECGNPKSASEPYCMGCDDLSDDGSSF